VTGITHNGPRRKDIGIIEMGGKLGKYSFGR